jgi:hypothetical protein
MKQAVKESMDQSKVFALLMRDMYVESAPIEQNAYQAYDGVVSGNTELA